MGIDSSHRERLMQTKDFSRNTNKIFTSSRSAKLSLTEIIVILGAQVHCTAFDFQIC